MDAAGGRSRGKDRQAGGQVLLDGLGESPAHVAAVKPDVAPQKRELADALGRQTGRRRQHKTRPVLAFQAGPGQQGILCAAADVHAEHRARVTQKFLYGFVHASLHRA